jgi:N6-L-threonylcarbamoyladenine synthase
MKILSIETSCDETGVAVVRASGGLRAPKFEVLKNLVSSQIRVHRPFGGVVPNLAKREHLKNLPLLWKKIVNHDPKFMNQIDLITVTVGPGLEPALWTGIEFAKQLAKKYKKPLVGANHLEGHLYSFLLPVEKKKNADPRRKNSAGIAFPSVALIVSGGHTVLLRMESFLKWRRLGETRDDAAGEAFDKVARLLDLPYPGGPEIEKLAGSGSPDAIAFPRPMLHEKNYDFSFSGLKTSVLYYLKEHPRTKKADIAASFQKAAVDVLVAKTIRAAATSGARGIILCGGVAANNFLRENLMKETLDIGASFFAPRSAYNFDNAAMIGAAGYMAYLRKKKYSLRAQGTLDV